jgi:hypothetical protein
MHHLVNKIFKVAILKGKNDVWLTTAYGLYSITSGCTRDVPI